jgi:energy-coupling factor transporter ATP-binding protein EcfA2
MIRLFIGAKGSGKTKRLIGMVNAAVEAAHGNVVCLERDTKLTYDIHYRARLIQTAPYKLDGYPGLRGFISGLYAANYDTTDVFFDSLYKITGTNDAEQATAFLDWLDAFGSRNGVSFTVTISAPESEATGGMLKYVTDCP